VRGEKCFIALHRLRRCSKKTIFLRYVKCERLLHCCVCLINVSVVLLCREWTRVSIVVSLRNTSDLTSRLVVLSQSTASCSTAGLTSSYISSNCCKKYSLNGVCCMTYSLYLTCPLQSLQSAVLPQYMFQMDRQTHRHTQTERWE